MRIPSLLFPLFALGVGVGTGLIGCASQPAAKPASPPTAAPAGPSPAAKAALEEAGKKLAEVKKAGHEWRLIDKATGPDSQPLTRLLEKGRELAANGDNDEAIRLAGKVSEFSDLGLKQAAENVNAGPVFPK